MINLWLRKIHWWIILLVAVLIGCGKPYITRTAKDAEFTPNSRIAVLPFDNLTSQDQVSAKVTELFQTLMTIRHTFRLAEASQVQEALHRHRIRSAVLLSEAQMDTLAAELNIQYIISGSVLEYTETDNAYLGKVPQVSFNSRMIDCRTKQTVWTGVSNDSGDRKEILFGIGVTRSADELARQMIESLVNDIQRLFGK
jgi:TolB-like protein